VTSDVKRIYFLTSAESKLRVYCDICGGLVDGVACIRKPEVRLSTIIVKCHNNTFGLRITDELLSTGKICGFILNKEEKVIPVERNSRIDPIVSIHTIILEEAIRQAKEKIYKKIYGSGGQFVDSSKYGIVRSAMSALSEEVGEQEAEEILGPRRRIILE
jgi:hypothetical protein